MKNNKLTKTDLWAALLCLMSMIPGAIFYSKMPAKVPMHWDINSNPDSFAPKWLIIFVFPLILCVVNILICFFSAKSGEEEKMPSQMKGFVRFIIPVIAIALETVTVGYSLDVKFFSNVGMWVSCLVGVLFVIIGNYLPKTRQNAIFGIKIPPTLKSETVWVKTHRMAGWLYVAAGFAFIILALAELFIAEAFLLIAVVAITFVYPFVISEN